VEFWNLAILIGAGLLLVAIVASDISSRMGAPLLLVFLFLGMLAGEDGPGGIRFDDFETAYVTGTLAPSARPSGLHCGLP
jgi:cell volume regulation protein A